MAQGQLLGAAGAEQIQGGVAQGHGSSVVHGEVPRLHLGAGKVYGEPVPHFLPGELEFGPVQQVFRVQVGPVEPQGQHQDQRQQDQGHPVHRLGDFPLLPALFLPLGLLHLQGSLGPLLPFLPGRLLRGLGLLLFRGFRSGTGPAPAVVLQANDLPLFRRLMFAALRHGSLSFPGPLSKRPD